MNTMYSRARFLANGTGSFFVSFCDAAAIYHLVGLGLGTHLVYGLLLWLLYVCLLSAYYHGGENRNQYPEIPGATCRVTINRWLDMTSLFRKWRQVKIRQWCTDMYCVVTFRSGTHNVTNIWAIFELFRHIQVFLFRQVWGILAYLESAKLACTYTRGWVHFGVIKNNNNTNI